MSLDRWLAILGLVLAVAGLYAAWYFYRAALPTRAPTFLVDPVRATLVDRSSSPTSDLTIQYKGHPIGPKAVNVVRVYFWNSGNTPITHADILQTLTITIAGNESEILDTKILKVSRNLTGIAFAPQEGTRNTLNAKFELLETDDGAALQITYAGPRDAALVFHGATIGAPQPTVKVVPDLPQQVVQRLSPFIKWLSGIPLVLFTLSIFSFIVATALSIPSARIFIYKNIFRRDYSYYDERLIIKVFLAVNLLVAALIAVFDFTQPPEISGEIPSALVVKD